MRKLIFEDPESLFNALASEKKIAVFETDDKGNAINLISELTIKNFEISSSNDDVLKMAVLYINQYYTKDFRLDALARLCDISKSYLCKLFKPLVLSDCLHYPKCKTHSNHRQWSLDH